MCAAVNAAIWRRGEGLFQRFVRGDTPDTSVRMPPAGRAPPCTCPLLKKRDQNFSTEKFLGCEQSAVNLEYSEFARPAECKGRLNLFANLHIEANASDSAETFSIKSAFAEQKLSS